MERWVCGGGRRCNGGARGNMTAHGNGDDGAVRCCAWAKEEAESKMRAQGWSGRVLGMMKARCVSTSPDCSDWQRCVASLPPRGGHALLPVGH